MIATAPPPGCTDRYAALLGTITSSSIERTRISSIKFLFAFAAGQGVKATLPFLTEALGAGDLRRGYELTFLVYGVVATDPFLVTFAFTRQRVTPSRSPIGGSPRSRRTLPRAAARTARCKVRRDLAVPLADGGSDEARFLVVRGFVQFLLPGLRGPRSGFRPGRRAAGASRAAGAD